MTSRPQLDLTSPSRTFAARWRELTANPESLRPLTIALAASFTVEPLCAYLGCFLAQRGLFATFTVAPFDQIYPSLLDPHGAFAEAADVTIVLPRFEDIARASTTLLSSLEPDRIAQGRDLAHAEIERLSRALTAYEERTNGFVLVGTLPPPANVALTVLDASHGASVRRLIDALNIALTERAHTSSRRRVFDFAEAISAVGTERAYDARMWHLAKNPFATDALRMIGERLARTIAPLFVAPSKVVVLDLDNTLWGGVIGEDGMSGISLGGGGVGDAFVEFQEALLALRAQGVLLCLASKNNEADAWEVFEHHEAMRLRREHITAHRISWQPKSESLRALARELSLGLDSFVFLDDSPVEREEVRHALPNVIVPDLPEDPARFVSFLRSLPSLDRMTLTAEDRARAEQYAAEKARSSVMERATEAADPEALANHLRSLELKVVARAVSDADIERAAQLTQKTNQWNLTTIRRSAGEMTELVRSVEHKAFVVSVVDRFGDYGTTGLAIVRKTAQNSFELDTMLLSCRVLGRSVETALLSLLVTELAAEGADTLTARFVPTAKNAPAATFLSAHGFSKISDVDYTLDRLSERRFSLDHVDAKLEPSR